MKTIKKHISNLFFTAVLIALLYPLAHSFCHFFENNTHEKCVHKKYDKTNFEHKHKVNEHCTICNFHVKFILYSTTSKEFKILVFTFLKPNFSLLKNTALNGIDSDTSPRGPPYINVI